MPEDNFEAFDHYKDEFKTDLERLHDAGNFCIATNKIEGEKLREICKLWPLEFITSFEFVEEGYINSESATYNQLDVSTKIWNLYVFRAENVFNMSAELWLSHTLHSVHSNELPLFILEGQWMDGYKNTDNRVKCQYSALLAYNDCVSRNIQLLPFLPTTLVGDDLQIVGRFASYKDVEFFRERFLEYLNQSAIWHVTEVAPNPPEITQPSGR